MSARGWQHHEGLAVGLPMDGIDTDQIIPARFMATPRDQGYGRFLLHDLRCDAQGAARPDFALNRAGSAGASVLVAGRNFGCGSSREAAVYALVDYGIRVVVAPSFGDIFAANAVNNGLCPAQVCETTSASMLDALAEAPRRVSVDLESCEIIGPACRIPFALDPVWRHKLMEGWDDIDLTRAYSADIAAFRDRDAQARPWARLRPPGIVQRTRTDRV
ncbi:3-isopropylmalate dehydratase small subunit [Dinoroseobacter sp. S124A]|uniref:3-isopropylmalate dehydratase small subunit n=1 Tax=Dinoroseobacter sp. S124A TaxID=3415128 RepID=UPI003C7DED57